ncbi:hypothetical protein MC885_014006 [Smutsia gigantea]|nr:hypothetical protein MC885_014006 [Smutsia gigantea]
MERTWDSHVEGIKSPFIPLQQLVQTESPWEGTVTWKTYHTYIKVSGGLLENDSPLTSVTPLDLSFPLAGYLLSLFVVFFFFLMMGSSALSNWWLGLWLDKGSQASFPFSPGKRVSG